MRLNIEMLRLYLVTDSDLCRDYGLVATVRAAVKGGVTMVQLRDKNANTQTLVEQGRAVLAMLAGSGVSLIINDNVSAAIAIGSDGIHVGQGDMRIEEVRSRVGRDMIVGLSCETLADAQNLADAQITDPNIVDYIGVSPIFATPTKMDHSGPVGLSGLSAIAAATSVPKVAIGGIKYEHCAAVFANGADGIAVVSAICGQADPEASAARLAQEITRVAPLNKAAR